MTYRALPTDERPLIITFNMKLMAVDSKTGRVRWEHSIGRGGNASTLRFEFTDTHVFAVNGNSLACVEYPSGKLVWKVETRDVHNQNIFLMTERIVVGGNGTVEAFSYTGEPLWHNGMTGKGFGMVSIGLPDKVAWADGS